MNNLKGKITEVKSQGSLSLVWVEMGDHRLSVLLIDTSESLPFLNPGQEVSLVFKETEVILVRGEPGISIQNRIDGKITAIEAGKLLSKVSLEARDGQLIQAILNTEALQNMDLKTGEEISAYVKSNEIMITA